MSNSTLNLLSAKPSTEQLYQQWLSEAVRLREEHSGTLEDSQAVRLALQQPADLVTRLQTRALFLAKRDGLEGALVQWLKGIKLTRWLLMLLAVLLGIGLSKAALFNQAGTVNVFLACLALLGAHSLSLLIWLISLLNPYRRQSTSGITQAALWLSELFARRAKQAQLLPALIMLLQRQKALVWLSAKYLHLWWLLVLLSCLASFLLMLSTQRYGFAWESTIVNSHAFSGFIQFIGWLPHSLGFPQPSTELIQRSGELASFVEADRHTWAYWLVGLVVVYGIVPRAVLSLISHSIATRRLKNLALDPHLPVWLELHERLMPRQTQVVDAAPDTIHLQPLHAQPQFELNATRSALTSLEINPKRPWPPSVTVPYLGALDSRAQRHLILDQLSQQPLQRLLVACDPSSSIDRGTLNLLADLTQFCSELKVWLLPATDQIHYDPARLEDWSKRLIQQQIAFTSAHDALQWLETADA